MNYFEGTYP